ncbi:MAG TPA: hypothetical protein VHJ58_08290, partial [Vicinamibacterales bacterium]|nr:hypothetical protein [Vicinamibacterales bacterium]
MPKRAPGALLLLLWSISAFSQAPSPAAAGQAAAAAAPMGTLREIIPGHYVYSVTTFNSGIVATSEGVVVL